MAARWLTLPQGFHRFRIHTNTTDFFRVEYGDVVVLGGRPYLIRHNAKEGRFGVDDEVKFWVKRSIDLESGSLKILKLVFHEARSSYLAVSPAKSSTMRATARSGWSNRCITLSLNLIE